MQTKTASSFKALSIKVTLIYLLFKNPHDVSDVIVFISELKNESSSPSPAHIPSSMLSRNEPEWLMARGLSSKDVALPQSWESS